MHMDVESQECNICGKQFKNKNTLQNHISLTHRGAAAGAVLTRSWQKSTD